MKKMICILSAVCMLTALCTFPAMAGSTAKIIRGDADGNGTVSINDVTAIQRHIAELELLSDNGVKAADLDGSGKIDINNATAIQRYLAEFDDPYHIGEVISDADERDEYELPLMSAP